MQPKLLQICANWTTKQKTVFKPNYDYRIVSFCRNCKETSSKSEQCLNICVIDLTFSQSKKCFQKKTRSKEFTYFSERPRTGISKPTYVKTIPLLSINLKLNYLRNKLVPHKCPIFWKTQRKPFQICANSTNRLKSVFKLNYVYRIVSLWKKLQENFS